MKAYHIILFVAGGLFWGSAITLMVLTYYMGWR
jgi:hypothetical protein